MLKGNLTLYPVSKVTGMFSPRAVPGYRFLTGFIVSGMSFFPVALNSARRWLVTTILIQFSPKVCLARSLLLQLTGLIAVVDDPHSPAAYQGGNA